jgi:hypothetical protein
LLAYMTAVAAANPSRFARLVRALLVEEFCEGYRARGLPVPPGGVRH